MANDDFQIGVDAREMFGECIDFRIDSQAGIREPFVFIGEIALVRVPPSAFLKTLLFPSIASTVDCDPKGSAFPVALGRTLGGSAREASEKSQLRTFVAIELLTVLRLWQINQSGHASWPSVFCR